MRSSFTLLFFGDGVSTISASDDRVAVRRGSLGEKPLSGDGVKYFSRFFTSVYAALVYAALVGSDVCILPAAFEGFPLREGSIGWRGQVTAKRGGGLAKAQVEIFGTYFSLLDRSKILPIVQPEEEEEAEDDEDGGEDEEGEEEGSNEEEGEEEADEEMEHDSSGDELPRKKSKEDAIVRWPICPD